MSSRERLDVAVVARGLAESLERAQRLILAGLVRVEGERVNQAGYRIRAEQEVKLDGPAHPYASRGGVKLAGALDGFDFDPAGRICVDVGASTGGFTDCLLQRGASLVHAIDVGYGQLAWKLRQDARVRVMERTNIRKLEGLLDPVPTLAVIDASFISLRVILAPTVAQLAGPRDIIALVKPQFEVAREQVGKGGLVSDPAIRRSAVDAVVETALGLGLVCCAVQDSTLPGAKKGNVEIFVHLRAAPGSRWETPPEA
ncbi:MAG: TlyA family RNA methyltransferase [Deltaproteobacteria bacterium]